MATTGRLWALSRDGNSLSGGALLKVLGAVSIGAVMKDPSIKARRERYGIQIDFAANKSGESGRVECRDLLARLKGPWRLGARRGKPGGPGPAKLKTVGMA